MGVGKRFPKWVTWPLSLLKSEPPPGLAWPPQQVLCTLPPPLRALQHHTPNLLPPLPTGANPPTQLSKKILRSVRGRGQEKERQHGGSCEFGTPLASTLLRGNGRRHLPFQPPASFPLTTSRAVFLALLCRRHHKYHFYAYLLVANQP